jgi:hypothetical protein
MTDLLKSSKFSLANGRRHIKTLESEIKIFLDSKPYRKTIEFNFSGHTDIHKIKLIKELPDLLNGIAFDAVSNLRASLDQCSYAVAIATGGAGRKAGFPFGDTATEVASRITGDSKEIPLPIFNKMLEAKPYKDGNIYLWALNRLCNYSKHKFIVPTAMYTGGGHLRHAYFSSARSFSFPPKWDHERQEMIIAEVPYGAQFSMDMHFQMLVSFANVDGIPGDPCTFILEQAAIAVENIIQNVGIEIGKLDISTP